MLTLLRRHLTRLRRVDRPTLAALALMVVAGVVSLTGIGMYASANPGGFVPVTWPSAAPAAVPSHNRAPAVVVPPATTPALARLAPAPALRGPTGEPATVARVIDGDTFVLDDGRHIRVLGIDSCENHGPDASPGGDEAKQQAEDLLMVQSGGQVTLAAQPGAPDRDRYGRPLRYVELSDGSDFAEQMVGWDHTGIYQGHNDASAERLARLYAHDLDHAQHPPSGRECGTRAPVDDPGPVEVPSVPHHDDDHHRLHLPGLVCRHTIFC